MMRYFCKCDSPLGPLYLGDEGGFLSLLVFSEDDPRLKVYVPGMSPILAETKKELSEYFTGERRLFQIPLRASGTEFQQKVWQELQAVPYGETRTYKDIAERVGSPRGSRAVGLANNKNPISIIIPCHRVVGQNGKLTGYAGGLDAKGFLLELEHRHA